MQSASHRWWLAGGEAFARLWDHALIFPSLHEGNADVVGAVDRGVIHQCISVLRHKKSICPKKQMLIFCFVNFKGMSEKGLFKPDITGIFPIAFSF